jgi:two-component system chemotaxis response regulator CheB
MSGIRILIVDDSVTIRAMLEQVIAGDPDCIVVGVAADAGAAKDLVATSWPDVITLDLTMPGIGGLGFLRELQNVSHPPVLVISSTTKDGAPETAEALAEGAAACFDKSRLMQEMPRFLRTLKRAGRAGQKRKSSPEPMRRHVKTPCAAPQLQESTVV